MFIIDRTLLKGPLVSEYTLGTTVDLPFADALERTRAAIVDVGFGVVSEINLAATLHAKLGVDVPEQIILGACRPDLAYQAVQSTPEIAALLPCNVVVRAIDATHTRVEAIDPAVMVEFAGPTLTDIAADARTRLVEALAQVGGATTSA